MQSKERDQETREMDLKLKAVEDEIVFEEERIRHGGIQTEGDEELEKEILQLRQLRAVQTRRVGEMENANKGLSSKVRKRGCTPASCGHAGGRTLSCKDLLT